MSESVRNKKKRKKKRKPFSGKRIVPQFSTITQKIRMKKWYTRRDDKPIKDEEY